MGSFIKKSLVVCVVFGLLKIWRLIMESTQTNELSRSKEYIAFPVQICSPVKVEENRTFLSGECPFANKSAVVRHRVLILSSRPLSFAHDFVTILESHRMSYDIHNLNSESIDALPSLTDREIGNYAVVVFTSFTDYFELSPWRKRIIDGYCRYYGVGMVLFNDVKVAPPRIPSRDYFPFEIYSGQMQFNLYHVSANASMLRLVTGNNMLDFEESHMSSGEKWSIFLRQNARLHEHFEIVATSSFHSAIPIDNSMYSSNLKFPVVLHDLGQLDKIQRIYFGAGLSFWPHKLLFLDALGYMSSGKLAKSLDRWIQVDIDDIFVGRSGIRMKADDVQVT